MAYTAAKLIARSWNLAGIVGRQFQTVEGDEEYEGLELLNEIIAIKMADPSLIPYYTIKDFDAEAGRETYFIPNLVETNIFTFFLNGIRYSSSFTRMDKYYGTPKPTQVQSLPVKWNVMRCMGGSNLNLWFTPDLNYPLEIVGKFCSDPVTLAQDMSLIFDTYYLTYLRYALAKFMTQEYNLSFSDDSEKQLRVLENYIRTVSPKDMTIRKQSTLAGQYSMNIAQYVLGQGYTPG